MTTLADIGEDALVRRLLRHAPTQDALLTGPGDDCAAVRRDASWDTLLKTDVVVESVHFCPETDPELIGRKALARPLSDIAAMGGIPEHALVTILASSGRPVAQLEGIYRGIHQLAARFNISLAGGETSGLPVDGLVINVALTGRVEHGQAFLRSGGRVGDVLCVSGRLGGSFASGRHLLFEPRVELARTLRERRLLPHASMDLSDGLATDLPRLAAACHCGAVIEPEKLPLYPGCGIEQGLRDGEDYELLMSFAPEVLPRLLGAGLPLTPIGRLVAEGCGTTLAGGWQHFLS